jgi:hypothetical protein
MPVTLVSSPIKTLKKDKPLNGYSFFLSRSIEPSIYHIVRTFINTYGGKLLSSLHDVKGKEKAYFISSKKSRILKGIEPYVPEAVFQLAFDPDSGLDNFRCGIYQDYSFSQIKKIPSSWMISVTEVEDWVDEDLNQEKLSKFQENIIERYKNIISIQHFGENERECESLVFELLQSIIQMNSIEEKNRNFVIYPQYYIPKADRRFGTGYIDFVVGLEARQDIVPIALCSEVKKNGTILLEESQSQCICELVASFAYNMVLLHNESTVHGILSDGCQIQFFSVSKAKNDHQIYIVKSKMLELVNYLNMINEKEFYKGKDFELATKILCSICLQKNPVRKDLRAAFDDLREKNQEIKQLKDDLREKNQELKYLREEIEKLKHIIKSMDNGTEFGNQLNNINSITTIGLDDGGQNTFETQISSNKNALEEEPPRKRRKIYDCDQLIKWIMSNVLDEEARIHAIDVVSCFNITSQDIEENYLNENGMPKEVTKMLLKNVELGLPFE